MELRDVILSTLAEMEGQQSPDSRAQPEPQKPATSEAVLSDAGSAGERFSGMTAGEIIDDECRFLESVKERLLVLFEGFQSPNNTHIEAKVDLTLNFLEYLLSSIDSRIENIKKSGH